MEIALAKWLGTHAVLAFALALCVVLASVAGAWHLARHFERRLGSHPMLPQRILLARLVAGFGIVLAAGYAFAEMSEALDVREGMGRFDVALADTLRTSLPGNVLAAFAVVTHLGDVAALTGLCLVVAGMLLWIGKRSLAVLWIVAVAGNGLLNSLLKHVFERARPMHEHGLVIEDGWSFPSGHSSGSLVAYGMLAYVVAVVVPRRWALPLRILAAALAVTVGLSRVMLQVHYASDVLAGFASGLLWLTVCVLSNEWVRAKRRAMLT